MQNKKLIMKILAYEACGDETKIADCQNGKCGKDFFNSFFSFTYPSLVNKVDIENKKYANAKTKKKFDRLEIQLQFLEKIGYLELNFEAEQFNKFITITQAGLAHLQSNDKELKERLINLSFGVLGIVIGALLPVLVDYLKKLIELMK